MQTQERNDCLQLEGAATMTSDYQFLRSDTPITGFSEDKLQRSDLAQRLARRIAQYRGTQALTIGICGPWGSGKTSFVNLVSEGLGEAVRTDGEILGPVVLTPWTLATADDLAGELLKEVGRALERRASATEVAGRIAHIGADIFFLGLALLATTQGAAQGLAGALFAAAAAGELAPQLKAVANPITDRLNPNRENATVGELRARISKALDESNSLLVVALDDLERLPSDRIQEVFRVVSAIASFSNTVYILSMDRHRAANALNDVFGDGHAYLEKFLNLTFDLPQPEPSMIANLMIGELDRVLARHEFPDDLAVTELFGTVWHGGLKHFIQTPRDVVRILNSFDMALESIADEVHPVDLLALETLRATEPRFHQRLAGSRSAVLRGRGDVRFMFAKEDVEKESEGQLAKLIEEAPESTRHHLIELLGVVFPLTRRGTRVDYAEAHRRRRATSPDHFDHYFRWSLASSSLSERDLWTKVDELRAIRSDRDAKAWVEANASRFQLFGEKLSYYLSDLGPAQSRFDLVAGLLRVAHLLDDSVVFIRSDHMLAQSLAYQAIKHDERARTTWPAEIWERCRESELLYGVARYYVFSIDARSDSPLAHAKPDDGLRSALAERLSVVVHGGSLDKYPHLGALLFRWRDIAGSEEGPRSYVSRLLLRRQNHVVWAILEGTVNLTSGEPESPFEGMHDATNARAVSALFSKSELASFLEATEPHPKPSLFAAVSRTLTRWRQEPD
jgi:hypothetical protein